VSLEQHSHDSGSQVCHEVPVQPGMKFILAGSDGGVKYLFSQV